MDKKDTIGRVLHLMIMDKHGCDIDARVTFQDAGVTSSSRKAFLLDVQATFGVQFDLAEHRQATSLSAVYDLIHNKVFRHQAVRSLRVLAAMDWTCANAQEFRSLQFWNSVNQVWAFAQRDILAASAEFARTTLNQRLGISAPEEVVVAIASESTAVQILTFLAAMRCGALPILLPKPYTASAARVVAEYDAKIVLVGHPDLLLHKNMIDTHDFILAPEYGIACYDAVDPCWTAKSAREPCDVAWLHYRELGIGRSVTSVTHAEALGLASELVDVTGACARSCVVSWFPLTHRVGIITSLLVPMLFGHSSALMPPAEDQMKLEFWLHELGKVPGTIGFAPPGVLLQAADRIPDDRIRNLNLSGLSALGTSADDTTDRATRKFIHRFEAYGFRGDALKFHSSLTS